ncbi:MAG: ThuA domain-containing protein [Chthoniobacteraceae bacterium]
MTSRIAFLLSLFAATQLARAVEPWADAALPVKGGIALWLDTAAQKAGRATLGLPAADSRQTDVWLDGSGHARHARQPVAERRPVMESGALRFDGVDDFLFADGLTKADAATVFIVAAARTNAGQFRALASFHPLGRNDYSRGLNIDLGAAPTSTLDCVNIEGAGARGQRNLLGTRFDFGTWHVFAIRADAADVQLSVDGKREGTRARQPGAMQFDEVLIGARCYSNEGLPPRAQGFFDGHIAEVIAFDRAVSGDEQAKVERYLIAKHAQHATKPIGGTKPLQPVANPPPVQMLVPGFEVKEAPLKLPNINNLRYRPDGKLVALGYDGRIHLLSDTDGDGIEDKAALFWEKDTLRGPIGMALTPPGYTRGQGVFVASNGKLALIVDTNGDDRADEEIVVASGWTELSHRVDALGVAVAADGSIYFGLGAANFTNAYLLDPQGKANYDVRSERGTILKVSPDFSKRDVVCTGIRFPVGLVFNSRGDLFCTDQEGATWLPNGNPFDELLHIEPARHYGFPPRHPQHLTGVIDEPSVFDFAPQHQSACGFFFNEGARTFGPEWWKGDALVCGESRGKLWRVKLAKTRAGYVAQSQLVACLASLPVDAALSPRGDLVVASHSGAPDWGSGPRGEGRLFHVRRADAEAPLPVLAWAASPSEIRVAFDRPLKPEQLRDFSARADATDGRHVFAADRYESLRPGYQVVRDQLAAPRFGVPILGTSLSQDGRTLTIRTAPRTSALNCALTLPAGGEVDIASDLSGLAAEWSGRDGAKWNGWLPHIDTDAAREFTTASAEHDALWRMMAGEGRLTLRGQFDLAQMLRPAVQSGAQLGYNYAPETVSVVFSARASFHATLAGKRIESVPKDGRHEARIEAPKESAWVPFEIESNAAAPEVSAHWFTAEDSRPRAFALRRILVPWACPADSPAVSVTEVERDIPEIRGGNWLRGKALFSGKALCASCHVMHGAGGKAGPDLSNLAHRDYASVLKDIVEPSAALNPDHPGYSVELNDGTAFAGVMHGEKDGVLRFADITGPREVPRAKLKHMEALPVSLMPPGLLAALSADEQRDLLTFLLQPPFEPAPIERADPPPPRKRAEIEPLLAPSPDALPFHIVLCAGPKDHGPGEHDYPLWQRRWARLLAMADGVTVSTAWKWPSDEQWQKANAIVFYSNNPSWNAQTAPQLDAFLARGGGVAFFHYAVDGHKDVGLLAGRIGLAWRGGGSKFRHGALDLALHPHALSAGLPGVKLIDESYWQLVGDAGAIQLIASGTEEGRPQPLLWTKEQGGGRIFVSIPGHYSWTFDDPLFRLLAFRGICWAAGQPMDRLAPLVMVGARVD